MSQWSVADASCVCVCVCVLRNKQVRVSLSDEVRTPGCLRREQQLDAGF